ncbi:MAG TPA: Lrp/AsnC family transcriptional regulator [Gemmatimonadales bacterium]
MASKNGMDAIDRKILRLLAADARSSYQAIADEVGLSRPAVMERVKRLEEAHYVRGYRVELDRARVGFPVTAFVNVRYGNSNYSGNEPKMHELAQHPGVLECHHVAGDDCFILKVVAPDLDGLQAILRTLVGGEQQMSTRTTIVLGTVFEKPGLTLPEAD